MKLFVRDKIDADRLISLIESMPLPFGITISEGQRRNLEQNAILWATCTDIAKQIQMPLINGQLVKANPEEWKQFLSALHDNERRIAIGDNGEMIVLSRSTSSMSKRDFSSLIEFIMAFCANRGVKLNKPIPEEYLRYAA